ncbi:MAG: hypothetical protein U9R21_07980, partial [Candidatus Thermoplasmatota archaeon]|nr:hypothetical protein [Candidatus Thermoplasmatota archaeon]
MLVVLWPICCKITEAKSVQNHLIPPDYTIISSNNKFNFSLVKKDWLPLKNPMPVDDKAIDEMVKRINLSVSNHPRELLFAGWGVYPVLNTFLNAYLISHDEKYLRHFVRFYKYLLSVRMDKRGRMDFRGEILPQWERMNRQNIFHVSPYFKYRKEDELSIIKQRGWKNLNFSDVNQSGLFIEQALRFVQIVRNVEKASGFKEISDQILNDSLKVIDSHNSEWVDLNGSGYYRFPRNCPFYLDGVEMPVNEVSVFAAAIVRAYMITGKLKYKTRATKIWERWKSYMSKDAFGYITYPYTTGHWYEGWKEGGSVSINTPSAKSNKSPEVVHKASLTLNFLILLEFAVQNSTLNYLRDFHFFMLAALQTGNILSPFPANFSFIPVQNSANAHLPFVFQGWINLVSQNSFFLQDTLSYSFISTGMNDISWITYLQYISEKNIPALKDEFMNTYQEVTEVVEPSYLSDDRTECLWKAPMKTKVLIKFQ